MIEIWKKVKGYEHWYEVSDLGNVRSIGGELVNTKGVKIFYRGKTLSQSKVKGYKKISLTDKKGIRRSRYVHRLVLLAFKPNPNNYLQVNHINGVKTDNRVNNLEWCNQYQNMNHARCLGLINNARGSGVKGSKLSEGEVLLIRDMRKYSPKAFTLTWLSKCFSVRISSIYNIVQRKTWKHI